MERLSNLILALEDELNIQCPRHVMSKQTIRNVLDILRTVTAELARVKAESLHVVVVPEADHGLMYDWYMTPTGLGYPGKDRKNNNCIESAEGYYRLDECKPVRLERWEDE